MTLLVISSGFLIIEKLLATVDLTYVRYASSDISFDLATNTLGAEFLKSKISRGVDEIGVIADCETLYVIASDLCHTECQDSSARLCQATRIPPT